MDEDAYKMIEGYEKVCEVFGYWPSFHDAEVISMHLERETNDCKGPLVYLDIHTYQMTREVDERGYFKLINHCVIRFMFERFEEMVLDGFNHQNVLEELYLENVKLGSGSERFLKAHFLSTFGANFTITSANAAVVSVTMGKPEETFCEGKLYRS